MPALKENGFLPDFAGLPRETLERLTAVYICSPSNPEGAVADEAYWTALFRLAEQYDFIVLADECYADIWFDKPPACALPVRLGQSGGFSHLLSFHSLSKRSGLPGLRSGMVAGCGTLIEKFRAFRNVAGPTVPGPLQAASAAAWRDEAHVTANRLAYADKLAAAERILGNRMTRPGAGFSSGLRSAMAGGICPEGLARAGVRLLPGAYMGRENLPGKTNQTQGFPMSGWRLLMTYQPL